MAQHDYNIANQAAASARSDINNALAAASSTNSGATEPATKFANMMWYDTTNDLLKIRNEGNTAWISLGTVDQVNSKFEPNQTLATQAEAEAGTNNTKMMTPLRVAQAIPAPVSTAVAPNYSGGVNIAYNSTVQAPSNGVYIAVFSGSFINGIDFYAGSTGATILVGRFFDDINSNTKGYTFTLPVKSGTYFRAQQYASWPFESITITFYPNI